MTIKQILLAFLFAISPLLLFAIDDYIATSDLNVRSGAGTGYPVSFTLLKGDKVEVLSKDGNWYKIRYLGKIGYAYSIYLESKSDTLGNIPRQSVQIKDANNRNYLSLFLLILVVGGVLIFKRWVFEVNRRRRRDYYRNVYLKSDEWQRKRYVVLKRDNWRCVYCGGRATEVHHEKYAKLNIGKEPIEWLVSVCKNCHDAQHR